MSIFQKFMPPLLGKSLAIGGLILVLLIPIANVEQLVTERVGMRQEAAARVAESWGGAQTTAGVLLAIPVETTRTVIEQSAAGRETQRKEVERNVLYVPPDNLEHLLVGRPFPDPPHRYAGPVRRARLSGHGHDYGGIRPPMHPTPRRCPSVEYSRYALSSRLAGRAPRRPRCVALIVSGTTQAAPWAGSAGAAAGRPSPETSGSLIVTIVPAPGSLSIDSRPPCRSTTPYTTERPRPVPFSFVVKKGSSTFESCSRGIPTPVSAIDTSTA